MTTPSNDPGWQPSETVRIVAGTPPGGGQDRAARALAAALSSTSDLTVEVSNLPGRGGGKAWDRLAASPGDPHLLSISSPTFVTNHIGDPDDLGVDDLTHLALLCSEFIVFVVATESSIATGLDLLHAFGSDSTVVALATALGNVNHVATATAARHVGVDPRRLDVRAFDSARLAVAEVVEGRATVAAVSAASVLPEFGEGTIRAVAVSSPDRLATPLADVPTWAEQGVPSVIGTWRGVFAPPGLSPSSVRFWEQTIEGAIASPSWREALSEHVWADTLLDSGAARRFLIDEEQILRGALADLGLIEP